MSKNVFEINVDKEKTALANHIEEYRMSRGITILQIAEEWGISVDTYNKWKSGKVLPSTETILGLCSILGCDVDYLLGRLDKKNYDNKFICDSTGLSEDAIDALKLYGHGKKLFPDSKPKSPFSKTDYLSTLLGSQSISCTKTLSTIIPNVELLDSIYIYLNSDKNSPTILFTTDDNGEQNLIVDNNTTHLMYCGSPIDEFCIDEANLSRIKFFLDEIKASKAI